MRGFVDHGGSMVRVCRLQSGLDKAADSLTVLQIPNRLVVQGHIHHGK